MPHKHTRRRNDHEQSFDLAPSKLARPLPAFEQSTKSWQKGQKGQKGRDTSSKRKQEHAREYREDDTPKAFVRLMQLQAGQKQPSGQDDGEAGGKKKKRKVSVDGSKSETAAGSSQIASEAAAELKIKPGEKMSEFAARINQALPISGLARKGKQVEGMKERQTKTEKRLHKMYAQWREEEARRKEKLEELREQQEEEDDEKEAQLGGQQLRLGSASRKAKRVRMVGEVNDDEEDPWAVLKSRRETPKGLNDVVQAPPTMKAIPKEKFKVQNGAKVDVSNVPGAAGSLKRREELGEARKEVIERYRAMMKGSSWL